MNVFFCQFDPSHWDPILSIVASLLGIASAGGGAAIWVYKRRSKRKSIPEQKRHAVSAICTSYTEKISNWLSERITLLQELAKRSDLKTNTGLHTTALSAVAAKVDGFPGGFYILNEKGHVVDHLVPNHPEMDIRGYDASQREYFIECRRLHRPIISNAIRSADRNTEILVVAVPRYDDSGHFVGILDGVIDVISSPFSTLAISAASTVTIDKDLRGQPLLYLVDGAGLVIGTNSTRETIGKSIFAAVPEVRPTANGFNVSIGIGEKKNVADTPFSIIAIWKDDKS